MDIDIVTSIQSGIYQMSYWYN